MKRLVKTVELSHAKLYGRNLTKRFKVADCQATLEFYNDCETISVLQAGTLIRNQVISLVITYDHQIVRDIPFHQIRSFLVTGEVSDRHGYSKPIRLEHIVALDGLNFVDGGECRFEVVCTQEEIQDLLRQFN